MKKFLSVLLVIALCVSFTPAAFAYEGDGADNSAVIVVGDAENGEQNGTPAETQPAEAQPTETAKPEAEPNASVGVGVGLGGAAVARVKYEADSAEDITSGLEALADSPNSVLTLTGDIELSSTLEIGKSVTINLAGNELSFTGGNGESSAIVIDDGATVTLRGGKLSVGYSAGSDEEDGSGYKSAVYVKDGDFTFDEMTVESEGNIISVADGSSASIWQGTYSSDPGKLVPEGEGLEVVKNEDGTWTVQEKKVEATPEATVEPTVEPTPEPTDTPNPDPTDTPDSDPTETPNPDVDTMLPELPDPSAPVEPTPVLPTVGGPQDGEHEDDTTPSPEVSPEVTDEPTASEKLAQSIADTEEGGTVALTESITEDLTVNKSVTLDLSGNTITGDIEVTADNVTIEGGTVTGSVTNSGELTLSGVKMTKAGGSVFMKLFSAGDDALLTSSGTLILSGDTEIPGTVSLTDSGVIIVGANESNVNVNKVTASEGASGEMKAGTYNEEPEAKLIAEGYEYNTEKHAIMPIINPKPHITSADGQTTYDAEDPDYSNNTVAFNKDKENKNNAGKNTDLMFKVSSGNVTKLAIGADVDAASKFTQKSELTSNTHYTYDSTTQTITIKVSTSETTFSAFSGLEAGKNLIQVTITDGGQTYTVYIPVFVYPTLAATDNKFDKNASNDTVSFTTSDKPDSISVSDSASASDPSTVTNGRKLTEDTDYTVTDPVDGIYTVTILNGALKTLPNGTRYVAFWYGGEQPNGRAMAYPITVSGNSDVTVSPTSRDWTYGSNADAGFTLTYKNVTGATVNSVSCDGNTLNSSQYSVSNDQKTVTLKGPYLQTLINSDGTGHGNHVFTISTSTGTVTVSVYIKPLLSAKDNKNTHTKGTKDDLVFQSSAPVTGNVKVGNIPLKAGEYTVSSDGLTVTLKAGFLNERGAGNTFTLRGDTDYGTVSATFKVVAGTNLSSNSPATGDENNIVIWVALLALSGAAAVALLPKKKNNKG